MLRPGGRRYYWHRHQISTHNSIAGPPVTVTPGGDRQYDTQELSPSYIWGAALVDRRFTTFRVGLECRPVTGYVANLAFVCVTHWQARRATKQSPEPASEAEA